MYTDAIHNDDLSAQPIGAFHGMPIREWDPRSSAVRENLERRRRIKERKQAEGITDDSSELSGAIQ